MQQTNFQKLRESSRRINALFQALVLGGATILPVVLAGTASAAPVLTSRALTSTVAIPSTTTDLTWSFATTATAANVNQIEIEFCDAPLGTCATANTPTIAVAPTATLTGFTTQTVTSTTRLGGDNGGANNQVDIVKTTVDAGASLTPTISLAATDITNNAAANTSYYTRMRIYSDTGTTLVWEGVFAQSTSQTLTVSARVQEKLDFCVGATAVNDATTSVAADCAALTAAGLTSVDLGITDSGKTNVSPVPALDTNGNNYNGVAMIRTNAFNGAAVDYKAIQETTSGKLKVVGATCSGVLLTDQCFNSVGTTQAALVTGTENFGMAVAGVNCGSTGAYTCLFSGGTYNLIRDNNYDGDLVGQNNTTYIAQGNAVDKGQVTGTTTAEYAWDDTGTADRIASSTGSAVKVIDDEALILKFAATPSITTPTGTYQVQADFIATATF